MVDYLNDGETVQQAIQRLKPKEQKTQIKYKPSQRKKQKIEENTEENTPLIMNDLEKKKQFQEVLDIISKLTELSYFNVYSDSIEKIIKSYGSQSLLKWFYRTVSVENSEESEEYGPFTTGEIKKWMEENLLDDTEHMKIQFKVLYRGKVKDNIEWVSRNDSKVKEILY